MLFICFEQYLLVHVLGESVHHYKVKEKSQSFLYQKVKVPGGHGGHFQNKVSYIRQGSHRYGNRKVGLNR